MFRIIALLLTTSLMLANAAETSGGPEGGSTPAPVSTTPNAATAKPPAADNSSITMFIVLGGLGLFMYLMVIRPQKREEKKRQELVASVKPGHQVITIGGVHAEVVSVGETTVELRLGQGDRAPVVTFNKGSISTNVTAASAAAPK